MKELKAMHNHMKAITLLLSGYSNDDPTMRDLREKADRDYFEGRKQESWQALVQLQQPAIEYLRSKFKILDREIETLPVVGMYCGILEPSVRMNVIFRDEADWLKHAITVKLLMIEFGEHFLQHNVHLVDFQPRIPSKYEYGKVVGDVTFQKQLAVLFNDKISGNRYYNYWKLNQIASEAGALNLTMDIQGGSIIIYSIGQDYQTFVLNSKKLLVTVREMGWVDETAENPVFTDVALTNYGMDDGYGQSHTYAQAKQYLDGMRA